MRTLQDELNHDALLHGKQREEHLPRGHDAAHHQSRRGIELESILAGEDVYCGFAARRAAEYGGSGQLERHAYRNDILRQGAPLQERLARGLNKQLHTAESGLHQTPGKYARRYLCVVLIPALQQCGLHVHIMAACLMDGAVERGRTGAKAHALSPRCAQGSSLVEFPPLKTGRSRSSQTMCKEVIKKVITKSDCLAM